MWEYFFSVNAWEISCSFDTIMFFKPEKLWSQGKSTESCHSSHVCQLQLDPCGHVGLQICANLSVTDVPAVQTCGTIYLLLFSERPQGGKHCPYAEAAGVTLKAPFNLPLHAGMMALGLFSPHMFVSSSHSSQKINFCWEHNVVMRQVILAGLFLYLLYKATDSLSINYHQLWGLPGVFPLEISAFWAHSQVCCLEKQRWQEGEGRM